VFIREKSNRLPTSRLPCKSTHANQRSIDPQRVAGCWPKVGRRFRRSRPVTRAATASFTCANEAVAAAREAFERLSERGIEDRKRIIDHIRRISIDQCVELGTMEMDETKIGRLEHKIEKLKTLGERRRASSSCAAKCSAATTAWP
jgi:acyl-CoA reductase-like NAD-dependent aldehyde dehydrogenase